MQLTIEVLPAPLGPMIENSSPSLTPKLTSVSARTPPKRSDTPRTSKACSTRSLLYGAWALLGLTLFHPVQHVNGRGRHSRRPSPFPPTFVLDFTGVGCYGQRRWWSAGRRDLASFVCFQGGRQPCNWSVNGISGFETARCAPHRGHRARRRVSC